MLQGDTRHSASPADGVIERQIARVLVAALASAAVERKTFGLAPLFSLMAGIWLIFVSPWWTTAVVLSRSFLIKGKSWRPD
jgi:hypothetical protein